jgi:hypothetical protein
MRTLIPIAVASALLGCVHQSSSASSMPRSTTQHPPAMSALGQPENPAVRAQKQESEKLLNAVLPFAERMLSQRREIRPFGVALTRDGKIIATHRYPSEHRPPSPNSVAIIEKGLQQGASSGRYKAVALVLDMLVVPPGTNDKQHAIAIRLDHRGGYSVIVFYPYDLGADSLAIGKPFSEWGEQKIFSQ